MTDTIRDRIRHFKKPTLRRKPSQMDLLMHLTEQRRIAVIWSVEDVKQLRPDLTDNQAWHVLLETRRSHDACVGINWNVIDAVADVLYPQTHQL
ncbi:MAG: hypothetical protein R3C19_26860 [Planctomycetaceae bacterium]